MTERPTSGRIINATLIICGEKNRPPTKRAKAMSSHLKRCQFVVIRTGPHCQSQMHRSSFNTKLEAFLQAKTLKAHAARRQNPFALDARQ